MADFFPGRLMNLAQIDGRQVTFYREYYPNYESRLEAASTPSKHVDERAFIWLFEGDQRQQLCQDVHQPISFENLPDPVGQIWVSPRGANGNRAVGPSFYLSYFKVNPQFENYCIQGLFAAYARAKEYTDLGCLRINSNIETVFEFATNRQFKTFDRDELVGNFDQFQINRLSEILVMI